METISIEELKERAQKVMQENKLKVVYATEDGQIFFDENRANLHASGKMEVYPLRREVAAQKETSEEGAATPNTENKNTSWFKTKK